MVTFSEAPSREKSHVRVSISILTILTILTKGERSKRKRGAERPHASHRVPAAILRPLSARTPSHPSRLLLGHSSGACAVLGGVP